MQCVGIGNAGLVNIINIQVCCEMHEIEMNPETKVLLSKDNDA